MKRFWTRFMKWLDRGIKPKAMSKTELKKLGDVMYPPPKPTINLSKTTDGKFQLKQRFPNFMTGFAQEFYRFDTVEEMKEAKFVKRWMEDKAFDRLSRSAGYGTPCLMVEKTDGSFWAVGYLTNLTDDPKNLDGLDLPIWTKKT